MFARVLPMKIGATVLCFAVAGGVVVARAQQAGTPSAADLQKRVDAISAALAATERQIEQSQQQMRELEQQLDELKQQMAVAGAAVTAAPAATAAEAQPSATGTAEERQQTTEAAVKVLDQIKVESESKYPVRVTGLVLFNSYLDRGVPDNADLPSVALRATATSGNGSMGASFRQTILGLEGDGPRVLGARTSANVNSVHYQGIDRVADCLSVEAVAPDGTIEAVWVHGGRGFALGVQWHPETDWSSDDFSRRIFEAFGDAVHGRAFAKTAPAQAELMAAD